MNPADITATYRLNLNINELKLLFEYLDMNAINEMIEYSNDSESSWNTLKQKLDNPIKIEQNYNKRKAMSQATSARTEKAKKKIDNAINVLRLENKEITHYNIAKQSGVAFVTVKKYIDDDFLKSLNKVK